MKLIAIILIFTLSFLTCTTNGNDIQGLDFEIHPNLVYKTYLDIRLYEDVYDPIKAGNLIVFVSKNYTQEQHQVIENMFSQIRSINHNIIYFSEDDVIKNLAFYIVPHMRTPDTISELNTVTYVLTEMLNEPVAVYIYGVTGTMVYSYPDAVIFKGSYYSY